MKRWFGAEHYNAPDICGVITSPVLRADGSLLDKPGYDEDTQLYLKPSWFDFDLPRIKGKPTKEDALGDLALFNELFDEFAFEGEAEIRKRNEGKVKRGEESDKVISVARSAAIVALLSMVGRAMMTGEPGKGGMPLFAVTAPKTRTGKGYLVKLICFIATGLIPQSTEGSDGKEEFEKRIEAALKSSRPVLYLDNLPNGMMIKGERLAKISTEPVFRFRELGTHHEIQADCRAMTTWIDGNNVTVKEDLIKRFIHIRLNRNIPRPAEHRYTKVPDPMEMVRKDRGKYVAAAIRMLWAHAAVGFPQPQEMTPVAGFGTWERKFRALVIWLGMPDPRKSMEEMRAADEETSEANILIEAIYNESSANASSFRLKNVKELIGMHNGAGKFQYPELRILAVNDNGEVSSQKLAALFRQCANNWWNGWQIKAAGTDPHSRSPLFCLENENGDRRGINEAL